MIRKVKDADSKESRLHELNMEAALFFDLYLKAYGFHPGYDGMQTFRAAPEDIRVTLIEALHEVMLQQENLEEFLAVDR